jgi:hypothetical protein
MLAPSIDNPRYQIAKVNACAIYRQPSVLTFHKVHARAIYWQIFVLRLSTKKSSIFRVFFECHFKLSVRSKYFAFEKFPEDGSKNFSRNPWYKNVNRWRGHALFNTLVPKTVDRWHRHSLLLYGTEDRQQRALACILQYKN